MNFKVKTSYATDEIVLSHQKTIHIVPRHQWPNLFVALGYQDKLAKMQKIAEHSDPSILMRIASICTFKTFSRMKLEHLILTELHFNTPSSKLRFDSNKNSSFFNALENDSSVEQSIDNSM